jgi:hypothetical protein
MPVDKSKYPPNWKEIVAKVRERSGGQCECMGECGLHKDHPGPRRCTEIDGHPAKWARGRVMLTTAHLCHNTHCDDLSHLRHLCNRCHLRYDSKLHQAHARATRHRKRAINDMFDKETD